MRSLPLICLISSAVVSLAITPANAQIVGCKDSNGNIVYREARDCPGLHQPGTRVVRNNTTGTTTGVVASPESRAAQLQVQQLQIQRDANVQRYNALQPSGQPVNAPAWARATGRYAGAVVGMRAIVGDNAQRVAPPAAQRRAAGDNAQDHAQAQMTCNYIGGTRICNDTNGGSSTANRIGNTTFINRTDGSSATVNRIGGTTFQNNSDGSSATSNSIGSTTFINRSDGSSATVNRIGGTTFQNNSDGTTRTCNTIGDTVFCN